MNDFVPVLPVFAGVFGYIAVSFVMSPIFKLLGLREEIHQAIIYYGNVWAPASYLIDREQQNAIDLGAEASKKFRELWARTIAFHVTLKSEYAYKAANWYIADIQKYNLFEASHGLLALHSDALMPEKTFRDMQQVKIRTALKLSEFN